MNPGAASLNHQALPQHASVLRPSWTSQAQRPEQGSQHCSVSFNGNRFSADLLQASALNTYPCSSGLLSERGLNGSFRDNLGDMGESTDVDSQSGFNAFTDVGGGSENVDALLSLPHDSRKNASSSSAMAAIATIASIRCGNHAVLAFPPRFVLARRHD